VRYASTIRASVLCALTCVLSAQDPLPSQSAPIRTDVPLVLITAAVVDRKDRPIDGLTEDDFVVTEDGIRQKIHMDTSDTVQSPVSLVVAIQSNRIAGPALARIRRVGSMVQPLIAGDRGRTAVITFDSEVTFLQGFTADSTKIRDAFAGVKAREDRATLIDAVAEGVKMLTARPENSRRIILIVSESRDRGSKMKLAQAVEQAQRAGVLIYPVTYSAQGSTWISKPEDAATAQGAGSGLLGLITEPARLASTNDADFFAAATGGRHLSFLTLNALEKVISRASEEIHSQYLLSFAPSARGNTGFHRVDVTVPSQKDAVIRARPGYWGK
jgi:VWFA-related protein